MGKERGETVVVMSGKPINGESAITCACGTDMVGVNIWTLFYIVDSRKVVLHVLTTIVT